MNSEEKDLNPFRNAKTKEDREKVWRSLRAISKPVSKEEADRLAKEALRLQRSNK